MTLTPGMKCYSPNKVCKLTKSIYGLKQASRQWYDRLSTLLLSLGFKQAHADHSLFTKFTSSSYMALLVYVDDIVLVGSHLDEFKKMKGILDQNFGIKDLGILKFFLGLEVAHSSSGISLCQTILSQSVDRFWCSWK